MNISGWYESEYGAVLINFRANDLLHAAHVMLQQYPDSEGTDFELTGDEGEDLTDIIQDLL